MSSPTAPASAPPASPRRFGSLLRAALSDSWAKLLLLAVVTFACTIAMSYPSASLWGWAFDNDLHTDPSFVLASLFGMTIVVGLCAAAVQLLTSHFVLETFGWSSDLGTWELLRQRLGVAWFAALMISVPLMLASQVVLVGFAIGPGLLAVAAVVVLWALATLLRAALGFGPIAAARAHSSADALIDGSNVFGHKNWRVLVEVALGYLPMTLASFSTHLYTWHIIHNDNWRSVAGIWTFGSGVLNALATIFAAVSMTCIYFEHQRRPVSATA